MTWLVNETYDILFHEPSGEIVFFRHIEKIWRGENKPLGCVTVSNMFLDMDQILDAIKNSPGLHPIVWEMMLINYQRYLPDFNKWNSI